MISTATHRLLLSNPQISRNDTSPKPLFFHSSTTPIHISIPSLTITFLKPLTRSTILLFVRVNSAHPRVPSQNPSKNQFVPEIILLFAFSLLLLCIRLFSNVFLPDFRHRWHDLIASSEDYEAQTSAYPQHLWQAIVACEDQRFFRHCGIDPFGVARAVLSLSARGGGSTITQQLVKNTFLKNERKISRKIVEMVLALAVERTMSKWRILSTYICKIYWGHGIYGIESASFFYFGKHPSLLSLGETAMLVGMVPAPELRSPLRDSTRGKIFQCRVLKRMVEVGILDTQSALLVAKQSLNVQDDGPDECPLLIISREGFGDSFQMKRGGEDSSIKDVWEWEKESKIREVLEDMEEWALLVEQRKKSSTDL